MVTATRVFPALFLSLIYLSYGFPARAGGTQTAERCGANQNESAIRIFADSDGHGWREYQNIKGVPEIQLSSGAVAQLWPGSRGNLLVAVEEPGEDFTAYTEYCFDKAGHLVQLRYELRTAWGWGYREEGSFANRKLKPEISQFFKTQTDKPINRPDEADNIPEALKPNIYLKKSGLPFFKLLSK
jgi:hypothetical protein